MTAKTLRAKPSRVPKRKADGQPDRKPAAASTRSAPGEVLDAFDPDEPDQPFAEGVLDTMDPDLRYRLISEAAFSLYQQRGYAEGYDLDDWLQAEAAVDHLLVNR